MVLASHSTRLVRRQSALHVLGVIVWIGGVSMVTTVILPAVRRLSAPEERIAIFERIEHRFSLQARIATVITGLTGAVLYYMTAATRSGSSHCTTRMRLRTRTPKRRTH